MACPYYGTVRKVWMCQLTVNRLYTDKNINITVNYGNNMARVFNETSNIQKLILTSLRVF